MVWKMFKLVFLVYAQGFIQIISAQWISAGYGPWAGPIAAPIAAPIAPCETIAPTAAPCKSIAPIRLYESAWSVPCGNGFGPASLAASNGEGLVVTSSSPIAPTGVSMTSENAYEGLLAISGAIPFLGAVGLEGALPTFGAGAVAYGCGNGNMAILSEEIPSAFEFYPGSFAYGFPGQYGINSFGYVRFGCGYNGVIAPYSYLGYGCSGPWF